MHNKNYAYFCIEFSCEFNGPGRFPVKDKSDMTHEFYIENGKALNWTANKEGFRQMRFFLFTEQNMHPGFLGRFCNVLDDIKEMPIGSTMFVITNKYECYGKSSLDELNDCSQTLEKGVKRGDLTEEYKPDFVRAFCIKRTEKRFSFRNLDCIYK